MQEETCDSERLRHKLSVDFVRASRTAAHSLFPFVRSNGYLYVFFIDTQGITPPTTTTTTTTTEALKKITATQSSEFSTQQLSKKKKKPISVAFSPAFLFSPPAS
jgi:hypothetical protein